jgi:hypothetical protein
MDKHLVRIQYFVEIAEHEYPRLVGERFLPLKELGDTHIMPPTKGDISLDFDFFTLEIYKKLEV